MNDLLLVSLVLLVYKVFCLLTGLAFGYMGYRLFVNGIFANAGDLETNWSDRGLVLRKAAPGTFFALFGTAIVSFAVFTGLNFNGVATGTLMSQGEVSTTDDMSLPENSEVRLPKNDGVSASGVRVE